MKIKEIIELDDKALKEKLENAENKLHQMKLNHSVTPLEDPSQITKMRRDIARMKTVLRPKELKK